MAKLDIHSKNGTYRLFEIPERNILKKKLSEYKLIVVDKKVFGLYENLFSDLDNLHLIEVSEEIKTPTEALGICDFFIQNNLKRNEKICAIGGGIIQDLVTFAASIFMRGIDWTFIPTTLLAQADSCIGGKSSLNYGGAKNIIGNFYPPSEIIINYDFLKTLEMVDIRSGIGEIIKVHLLSGQDQVDKIKNFLIKKNNIEELQKIIFNSLLLKNNILKIDPEDKGLRLIMNYGHSFGHALEYASNYKIPHGIAVTIGLDVANYLSMKKQFISNDLYIDLREIIISNLEKIDFVKIDIDEFLKALKKDKKNKNNMFGFILPFAKGEVRLEYLNFDNTEIFMSYFQDSYGK